MKKLIEIIRNCMKRFITKELIVYGITGVATTVVNYISYYLCTRILMIEQNMSNIISWVVAVIFAYVANKLWVFHSKSNHIREELDKIVKFVGARVVTLGIEAGGFYLMYTMMGIHDLITKAFLSIFVILVNYVFSKLIIFKKRVEA